MYLEYTKFSCKDITGNYCEFCEQSEWIGPEVSRCPRPYPDYSQLPEFHYMSYEDTPVVTSDGLPRPVDDKQPRVQLRKAYQDGILSSSQEGIKDFSEKYIVCESLIHSFITHLEAIDLRKTRRKRERTEIKLEITDHAMLTI